ncbi:MAG: phosphoribosylformylglycinamidine synthase subunit PurQ, partial [bacterium]
GSLDDIAGVCDETGRVFGLMPHPEAFHHLTNHPNWARELEQMRRQGQTVSNWEGNGVKIFRNAVRYAEAHLR